MQGAGCTIKFLLLIFCLLHGKTTSASDHKINSTIPNLKSCNNIHPRFQNEISRWTHGQWALYTWTQQPFDSKLPTVLFFNGGPGQSSHGADWTLPGWNVIFWDQRGVGCSKPLSPSQYYDQTSYSSESTAHDAKAILDLYGVKKASLLAVSYGTVPATIFAHKYPDRTQSVVLEGTLFSGEQNLHNSKHAQKVLIHFFNSLPANIKSTLYEWSELEGIIPTWYSRVGYYFLTLNDGLSKLELFFNQLIQYGNMDTEFFSNFGPREFEDEYFGFSAVVFSAIACGELSQGVEESHGGLILKRDGFYRAEDNGSKNLCKKYKFTTTLDYIASQFPVHVPVTYFQGVLDSATEATHAVSHFKSVPQKQAYLYLRTNGGHSPLLEDLFDPYSKNEKLKTRYTQYLQQALLGKQINFKDNDDRVWKWTYKSNKFTFNE